LQPGILAGFGEIVHFFILETINNGIASEQVNVQKFVKNIYLDVKHSQSKLWHC
jgi:hypothetical protein